ncbi:MAG: hypothetical protein KGO52_05915 [Nitrospirota bacterium]|nr:hypothetical protein [Nitrospirota bacterium]MDE3242236.1 hypothetical protein [Nitrospirota bacterium]
MADGQTGFSAGRCDACGSQQGPLQKLSLGKDFFGRAYDRLSPSSDQSPKWYCDSCSMHKNLQRDFRDIRAEFDKLSQGQPSELAGAELFQRAQLRLREIAAILSGQAAGSRLLDPADVTALVERVQARAGASPASGLR